MIAYPDCVACGGTGSSSRGHQCIPCANRRHEQAGAINSCTKLGTKRQLSRVEAGKAELMGLLRMMKLQNESENSGSPPPVGAHEETHEETVERKKREMKRLLERILR